MIDAWHQCLAHKDKQQCHQEQGNTDSGIGTHGYRCCYQRNDQTPQIITGKKRA